MRKSRNKIPDEKPTLKKQKSRHGRARPRFSMYIINRLAENNRAQWFLLIVSGLLMGAYFFMSMLDIGSLYYNVVQNTERFKLERQAEGVLDFQTDVAGFTSITTTSTTYLMSGVEFVFVDNTVIDKDSRYYIPSENVLVSPISFDFVVNYLTGTKFVFVFAFAVFLEMLRIALENGKAKVMSTKGAKIVSRGFIVICCVYIVVLLLLFA